MQPAGELTPAPRNIPESIRVSPSVGRGAPGSTTPITAPG